MSSGGRAFPCCAVRTRSGDNPEAVAPAVRLLYRRLRYASFDYSVRRTLHQPGKLPITVCIGWSYVDGSTQLANCLTTPENHLNM